MLAAGHSLGGALATLAAFDIRKQLLDNKQSNTKVVCYTFAAPRTGNHAFARDYNAMVPDTWSVINDQVSALCCCSCSEAYSTCCRTYPCISRHSFWFWKQIAHAALDVLSIDLYAIDAASESHILLQKPVDTSVGLPHNQTLPWLPTHRLVETSELQLMVRRLASTSS